MVLTSGLLAICPPELIARLVEQASSDADLTIRALNVVGLAPLPGGTRRLPGDFLLELGAAMRVMIWEQHGLDLHSLGLPSPQEAIRQAFEDAALRLRDPSYPTSPSLSRVVLRISVENLAWVGPRDLQAEILLDTPDEDALVEAIAQLVWTNRAFFSVDDGGLAS